MLENKVFKKVFKSTGDVSVLNFSGSSLISLAPCAKETLLLTSIFGESLNTFV